MELWGTFSRGNKAFASDADSYVKKFFDTANVDESWELEAQTAALKSFIEMSIADGRRVALVTSGSATVPLNTDSVMDAVSFGDRGAATAEQFLRAGYAVVFLSRRGSLAPFSRHFQAYIRDNLFMSMLQVQSDNTLVVNSQDVSQRDHIATVLKDAHATQECLFHLRFDTVQQYLFYLRAASEQIDAAGTRAMIVLAASVLEYYVPSMSASSAATVGVNLTTNSAEKTQETALALNLVRVPNLIRKIRQEYAPKAFLVTLKSVEDANQINNVAYAELERWGIDAVLADSPSRKREMAIVSEQENIIVAPKEPEGKLTKRCEMELDTLCAATLVEMHRTFTARRLFLKQGRQLLLLTAKFSMLKENDMLNEDADGNKNVAFHPGIRIRVDRGLKDASPIYELKAIFQTKTHCARGHLWERVNADSEAERDIVVAFSPAGTPDTIKTMWGDFWGGFADKEFADVREQVSHLTLSSALVGLANGVTATIGGDYSYAHSMMSYLGSKLGAAWNDGEQTRIRQSLQNMLSLNFNRGLTEMPHLRSVDELVEMERRNPKLQHRTSMTVQDTAGVLSHAEFKHPASQAASTSTLFNIREDEPDTEDTARVVKVHKALLSYFEDMMEEGLVDMVLPYVAQGFKIHVTGYSMGGMLGQLFMLQLGDAAFAEHKHRLRKVNGVFFGTPRVGDAGFAARLRLLYDCSQMINIMHPLDTVHMYPPTSEGYADAMMKVFLKEDGLGVGRRTARAFSILPVTRTLDRMLGKARPVLAKTIGNATDDTTTNTDESCLFCGRKEHCSEQHRCHVCTRRGDHSGKDCTYRDEGCLLCGNKAHATGEHRCSVCSQLGHRGRECHQQGNAGVAEMVTYFQFHDFLYYNQNLKKHVEFSTE
ncbi:Aste57867_25280 [Aphanomyces stellatus]|uniref:Aste57867_25280 protein n=1 Tax=Aphanomyces stellatus TaxID=120398 RepID=A0A485LSU8_9STRA|nr:hypothetical protein As57867_025202 [Aphanomyces stellatus]VFU01906.1 Aste57867_25280 [Aphanomyces stellatus]